MTRRGPARPPEPPDDDEHGFEPARLTEEQLQQIELGTPTRLDEKIGLAIAIVIVACILLMCIGISVAITISAFKESLT